MAENPEEAVGKSAPASGPATEGPAAAPAAGGSPATPPTSGERMSRRQKQSFRRELLKRLPRLGYTSWLPGHDLSIDEDLGNLVDLSADAVLVPYESLFEER